MGCTSSTTASVKQAPSAQPAIKESKIQSNTCNLKQSHGSTVVTVVTGTQPSRMASDSITNGNSNTDEKGPSPVAAEATHANAPSPNPVESEPLTSPTENKEPSPEPVDKASAIDTEPAPERPNSRSPKPTAQREGSPRSRRAKTAERRARTAGRAREKKELCAQERRDHMMRGLDRFRGAVRKLQGRRDIMERLKRESLGLQDGQAGAAEAVKASEAIPDSTPGEEEDGVIFSLDLEPEVDEGPIPTVEEYLERLRATAPVPE